MKIKKSIKINYDEQVETKVGEFVYLNGTLYKCIDDPDFLACEECDLIEYGKCISPCTENFNCDFKIFKIYENK